MAWTVSLCRAWVVRTKWSCVRPMRFQRFSKLGTTSSARALGVMPRAAAAFSIFWPCSSVPVRKYTSSPIIRRCRAITSARTVVYVWPMCGLSFT